MVINKMNRWLTCYLSPLFLFAEVSTIAIIKITNQNIILIAILNPVVLNAELTISNILTPP